MEQLSTFGPTVGVLQSPDICVAYLALSPFSSDPRPGGDAETAQWLPVSSLPSLALNHSEIVDIGLERARAKLEYSGLATAFCPREFTIPELRAVYEAVWGVAIDPRNFNRKITGTDNFLQPVAIRQGTAGRPAALYKLAADRNPATMILHPPVLRPNFSATNPV